MQLEELQIRDHQIRLAGRSDRTKGAFHRPTLPSRRVLQSKFPTRKIHNAAWARLPSRRPAGRLRPPAEYPRARRGHAPPTRRSPGKSPRRACVLSLDFPRSRLRTPGKSAGGRPAREPVNPARQRSGASMAQVRRDVAVLEHEVPVHSVPVMLEQYKRGMMASPESQAEPHVHFDGPSIHARRFQFRLKRSARSRECATQPHGRRPRIGLRFHVQRLELPLSP